MGISGTKLKRLREQKGLLPADVARFLGVSRPAYLKYENGNTKIPRQLEKLANYFGVTTDYLLDNEDKRHEVFSEDEVRLIYIYRQLNPERKELVRGMVCQLGDSSSIDSSTIGTVHNNGEIKNNFVAFGGKNSVSQKVTVNK